jgi:DHA2 family multidrug resistance protein
VTAPEPEFRLDLHGWLMLIGVMLALVLEILDSSIVNVALPSMMGNLGATVDEISWVVTSYIIANVIVIPMTSFRAASRRRSSALDTGGSWSRAVCRASAGAGGSV